MMDLWRSYCYTHPLLLLLPPSSRQTPGDHSLLPNPPGTKSPASTGLFVPSLQAEPSFPPHWPPSVLQVGIRQLRGPQTQSSPMPVQANIVSLGRHGHTHLCTRYSRLLSPHNGRANQQLQQRPHGPQSLKIFAVWPSADPLGSGMPYSPQN